MKYGRYIRIPEKQQSLVRAGVWGRLLLWRPLVIEVHLLSLQLCSMRREWGARRVGWASGRPGLQKELREEPWEKNQNYAESTQKKGMLWLKPVTSRPLRRGTQLVMLLGIVGDRTEIIYKCHAKCPLMARYSMPWAQSSGAEDVNSLCSMKFSACFPISKVKDIGFRRVKIKFRKALDSFRDKLNFGNQVLSTMLHPRHCNMMNFLSSIYQS